jgi:hypothetical protein
MRRLRKNTLELEVDTAIDKIKGVEFTPVEMATTLNKMDRAKIVAACLRKFCKEGRIVRTMHGIYMR